MSEIKMLLTAGDVEAMAEFLALLAPSPVDCEEDQMEEKRNKAEKLYRDWYRHYPIYLSLKLCRFIEASSSFPKYDGIVRDIALPRLHSLFLCLRERWTSLSLGILREVEKILFSVLCKERTNGKTLTLLCKVVSIIAEFSLEFRENVLNYMSFVIRSDFVKAVHIFPGLSLDKEFFMPLLGDLFLEVSRALDPRNEPGDWNVAFGAALSFAAKVLESGRVDLASNIANAVVKSVREMVKCGRGEYTRKGLEDWITLVRENAGDYKEKECDFVRKLIQTIADIVDMGEERKRVAQLADSVVDQTRFGLSVALIRVFWCQKYKPDVREAALICLYFLLLSFREEGKLLPFGLVKELGQFVLASLGEQNPENIFRLLSKITSLVSGYYQDGQWQQLQHWIKVSVGSEPQRVASIIRDLPFKFREEFFTPSVRVMLPATLIGLDIHYGQEVPSGDQRILEPDLDLESPAEAQRESWSRVEGILAQVADTLDATQEERRKVDPRSAEAIEKFSSKVRACAETGTSFTSFILGRAQEGVTVLGCPDKNKKNGWLEFKLRLPKPRGSMVCSRNVDYSCLEDKLSSESVQLRHKESSASSNTDNRKETTTEELQTMPRSACDLSSQLVSARSEDAVGYDSALDMILKSLWQIRYFRKELVRCPEPVHDHAGDPCVICTLQHSFSTLDTEQINDAGLDGYRLSDLRIALEHTHPTANGAAFLLMAIFQFLHAWKSPYGQSLVTSIFAIKEFERMNCNRCRREPNYPEQSSYGIVISANSLREFKFEFEGMKFESILKAIRMNFQMPCDIGTGGCGKRNHVHHVLTRFPAVFTVALEWEQNETEEEIHATAVALDTEIDLSSLYKGVKPLTTYHLISMVGCGEKEYNCIAYENDRWIRHYPFLKEDIGNWKDVLSFCRTRKVRPEILFYEATWWPE